MIDRRLLLAAAVAVWLPARVTGGCIHIGQTRHLDEEEFDEHIAKSDHLITFVEFSSPWCIWAHPNTNGHGDCATMRKAWDKLGEIYNYSKTISVAEVDCSRFITETHEDGRIFSKESLCRRFDIKSYPTVYVFSGETGIAGKKYKGEQTFEAMNQFLQEEEAKLCVLSEELEPSEACADEERSFLLTWKDKGAEAAEVELTRLETIMASREVTFGASKRAWMGRRINILKQLRMANRPPDSTKSEL